MPSRLIREQLEARIIDTTIEILQKGARVASHARSHARIPEHMPSAHRRYAEWTPARMRREAAKIGPATIALVEATMTAKPHPEQGVSRQPADTATVSARPPRLDQIDPAAWLAVNSTLTFRPSARFCAKQM